jgi:quercetin dioxygenase-like cupin family protein
MPHGPRRWIALAPIALLLVAAAAIAAAQGRPAGATWTTVIENSTLSVTRVHMPPRTGGIISPRTSPMLIVQVSAGEAQITQLGQDSRGPRAAGDVSYVAPDEGHEVENIGTVAFDQLHIAIKASRAPAPAAPVTEAPPGITRTAVLDNEAMRVVRVRFAPGAREPVHTHPNDLLTIQISPGTVEILNGANTSTSRGDPGFVQFLGRSVAHAFASADAQPFEILSISIK